MIGFFLKRKNIPFKIYEITDRTGGLIKTHTNQFGIAEQAASSLLWCDEFHELFESVRLKPIPSLPTSRAKFIVRNKKLRQFPLNPYELLSVFSNTFKKNKFFPESIYDFGISSLNKAITNQILDPVMSGIYAADIRDLSFPGTLPAIAKAIEENKFWTVSALKLLCLKKQNKLYPYKTISFVNGMGQLTDQLSDYLKNDIILNYDALQFSGTNESIICCLPAFKAAGLFKSHRVYSILNNVYYNPVTSITLYFNKKSLRKIMPGFGVLIPRNERFKLLGILFNSFAFENRTRNDEVISITCIIGKQSKEWMYKELNNDQILSQVLKELDSILSLKGTPLHYDIFKHPQGIPLYSPQLYLDWFVLDDLLRKDFPKIRLFGNYTGQISIRGMCSQAAKAVSKIT